MCISVCGVWVNWLWAIVICTDVPSIFARANIQFGLKDITSQTPWAEFPIQRLYVYSYINETHLR